MIPVDLRDSLEFIKSTEFSFSVSGIELDVKSEKNICTKAYELLKKSYPLPPIKLHLHKAIPTGAGLGGGSADAAFLLNSLNSYFDLNINNSELKNLASILGSDCPFFIENKPCLAFSRGEILENFEFSLSNYKIVIVHPGIHVNTAWAYQNSKPESNRPALKSILLSEPLINWKHTIYNDFENIVFPVYPEIKDLKEKMYTIGAIYASMTGSGSAVYGIFENNEKDFSENFSCFSWQGIIK
jgi:4-diphosphocytidyl-2-C-methyl-D-erythritol kinase